MQALVVGAGVIGLSTAIEMQRHGYEVTIWAKAWAPYTTSDVSAAIWYPYHAAPEDKVQNWGRRTLERFIQLSQYPETGVRLVEGTKYFNRPMGNPWWKDLAPKFKSLGEYQMVTGHRSAYQFEIPVVDMSVYLKNYLYPQFDQMGGKRIEQTLQSFDPAFAQFDLVVNCTGLGSVELSGDKELYPIRGQTVKVPALSRPQFLMDTDDPENVMYIIPRLNQCVLGGVAQVGNWSLEPDAQTTETIRRRCAAFLPELKNLPTLNVSVGLRPGRSQIRLEKETLKNNKLLIHNYGHGGSGVTLSWGCAESVVTLLKDQTS